MGRHWTPTPSQAVLKAVLVGFFIQGCEPSKPTPAKTEVDAKPETEAKPDATAKSEGGDAKHDAAHHKVESGTTGGTTATAGETGESGGPGSTTTGTPDGDTGESGKASVADADEAATQKADPAVDKAAEIKRLLARAIAKKTDDLEAMGALEQARQLGAKKSKVARAANRRGERLYATPDRAIRFFEWANRIDKRYATPSFNLAKIAVNRGELPQAKVHLREVAARKGHKLLKTLEYDPTFAVLADDPEIRRLWQR